jgi:hypothetical protein
VELLNPHKLHESPGDQEMERDLERFVEIGKTKSQMRGETHGDTD